MIATRKEDRWLAVWPGHEARFKIEADGIHIQRIDIRGEKHLRHNEIVLSFEDALAKAEGQLTFNLV